VFRGEPAWGLCCWLVVLVNAKRPQSRGGDGGPGAIISVAKERIGFSFGDLGTVLNNG